jgi:hypothetical protein
MFALIFLKLNFKLQYLLQVTVQGWGRWARSGEGGELVQGRAASSFRGGRRSSHRGQRRAQRRRSGGPAAPQGGARGWRRAPQRGMHAEHRRSIGVRGAESSGRLARQAQARRCGVGKRGAQSWQQPVASAASSAMEITVGHGGRRQDDTSTAEDGDGGRGRSRFEIQTGSPILKHFHCF